MSLAELDSRTLSGTDIGHSHYMDSPAGVEGCTLYPPRQQVRVILGKLGGTFRMSAPNLDIVAEGSSRDEAWARFLDEIRNREDSAWLMFDVGPTRKEEVAEGLDAPEDEDWSKLADGAEG